MVVFPAPVWPTIATISPGLISNETLFVGKKKIMIMPAMVPKKIKTKTIKSAVLHVPEGDPLYSINATRKSKFLGLFDSNMDVEIDLDAFTGKIKNEKRPWWSFLASVEEEEDED